MTTVLSKPGTLIHARGREWVILPDSTEELLMARPVGGLDEEIAGILPSVEPVQSAEFQLPTQAEDFILKCPEFVIVDEAHGCTLAGGIGRGRQQRFDVLRRIAEDESRNLILVTATSHSGNEEAFRSLLSLLDSAFANLPSDLDRAEREGVRRKLARHLVQRRRADILGAYLLMPSIP